MCHGLTLDGGARVATRRELLVLHQSLVVVTRGGVARPKISDGSGGVRRARLQRLALPPEPPGPPPEGAFLEHVLGGGFDGPVVPLAGASQALGQFDEALVEGEVVPDGVLPSLVGAAEEGEALLEEVVNLGEGEPLGGGVLYCHDDEGDVGVGGFLLSPCGFLGGIVGRGFVVCLRL